MDRNRAWLDPRCGRLGQISIPVPWSLHGHHRRHRHRSIKRGGWVLLGWTVLLAPFALSDFLDHGHVAASLSPQMTGAVASIAGDVGTYSSTQAFDEMGLEIFHLFQILLVFGLGLWVARDANRARIGRCWSAPPKPAALCVHLDFGWPRYHLPWLAGLVCLGIAGLHEPPCTCRDRSLILHGAHWPCSSSWCAVGCK